MCAQRTLRQDRSQAYPSPGEGDGVVGRERVGVRADGGALSLFDTAPVLWDYIPPPSEEEAARRTDAGWSSLVARWAHNPKVAGSNPAPATIDTSAPRG